jgi:hypothetical protein
VISLRGKIYNMTAFIAKMRMPWASHKVLGLVTRHERAMKGLRSGVKDVEDQGDVAEGEIATRSVIYGMEKSAKGQVVVPGLGHNLGKGPRVEWRTKGPKGTAGDRVRKHKTFK